MLSKIYCFIYKLQKVLFCLIGLALLWGMNVNKAFGQRVYADAHQESIYSLLGYVSEKNASTDQNLSNSTKLNVILGALGLLGKAYQNLQYTKSITPQKNSPLYFKMNPTGLSTLALLKSFKVQRTNNKALVGDPYTGSSLIDLLGIFGNADSTYLIVPPPSNSNLAFDGIRLTNGEGILNVAGIANIYFSFFIATPEISADSFAICQNAISDSLTLSLGNTGETGIAYYLFTNNAWYDPGSPLNMTAAAGYVGTFTNHHITIVNPFLEADTGMQARDYYIIAKDTANSPAFFYSAWKKITYKRHILEFPDPPTVSLP